MKAWFPDEIEFSSPLQTGAEVRFNSAYRPEPFVTEIIECIPPSVLEFRWDTNDTLRFEIRPDGDGCEFTLLDTFDELGKAARDAAGWHTCLAAFEADLDGRPAPKQTEDDWKQLFAYYSEQFGPDASSIGPPSEHPYSEEP